MLSIRRFSILGRKKKTLTGLTDEIAISLDHLGIPTISAQSRLDAFCGLGYITSHDRLFQMDLLRRSAAGRLSEIMGSATIELDIQQRILGFNRVAKLIAQNLPKEQLEVLDAYADGVNSYIHSMRVPPLEFLGLRYRPEPWTTEDSILVALHMFQSLTHASEEDERMMTVMRHTLPKNVADFLTPRDEYSATVLVGEPNVEPSSQTLPIEALASLLRSGTIERDKTQAQISLTDPPSGSNGWVIGTSKTAHGRAILANDLHLPLKVPNSWYRVALNYNGLEICGVVIPGLPGVIVGSTAHIAWGFTNVSGDFLDLVAIDINPDNPDEYRTPNGWKRFEVVPEIIKIRGTKAKVVSVSTTIWGPVSQQLLLGCPVSIHWTALDPEAVNIGLVHMDAVTDIEQAIDVMHQFGGPPMNAMIVDGKGHIAWTICGKIPNRYGFDGSTCHSWADGKIGWDGYIPAHELPKVLNPLNDYIVTANNRTTGTNYPYVIGHNYIPGYRAQEISRCLEVSEHLTEAEMFTLQLDTTAKVYEFYRSLALDVLTPEVLLDKPFLVAIREAIEGWDGQAQVSSKGLPILFQLRRTLAKACLSPYLQLCQNVDTNFVYRWNNFEAPLRMLLLNKIPETLPHTVRYSSWNDFIIDALEQSIQRLRDTYKLKKVEKLDWGTVNISRVTHPLANALPGIAKILNMPKTLLPGCDECIRVSEPSFGASLRMVVSPGQWHEALLHMPCGQSGRPFSRNYKDQHKYWAEGRRLSFKPGPIIHSFTIGPNK